MLLHVVLLALLAVSCQLCRAYREHLSVVTFSSCSRLLMSGAVASSKGCDKYPKIERPRCISATFTRHILASGIVVAGLSLPLLPPLTPAAFAVTSSESTIEKVPLLTKRTSDLQQYADIARGFKLLRPFGFNEFDGAGGGYAVKFASLFEVDENVVIGISPSSADKQSITDFGSLDAIGEKLAKKRSGQLISSSARETDGVVFYQFQFENPLDASLPRTGPKNKRPTKGIELYQLCVARATKKLCAPP